VLILAIISFGMIIGAIAQWILGQTKRGGGVDWAMALIAGLVGSFVGGLVFSLIAGDGLAFRPSGIIGSLIGALLVTFGWSWWRRREAAH
jgi:uncharacterized membrane protein YeaQ/YmgE (transglycosylase-associated protein family)